MKTFDDFSMGFDRFGRGFFRGIGVAGFGVGFGLGLGLWLVGVVFAGSLRGEEGEVLEPLRLGRTEGSGETILLVVGASGSEDFGEVFRKSRELWRDAAKRAGARYLSIGAQDSMGEKPPGDAALSDREFLRSELAKFSPSFEDASKRLWVVFVGHGTFDGKVAKFNLVGPDVSASDLEAWMSSIEIPMVVVNPTAASGPFVSLLSSSNRIVITGTRSGAEFSFARFGEFFAEAIGNPACDLDKDGQASLLESYLAAAKRVAESYAEEGRLATEHSLIDDNGDGLGTPADWFKGVRAVRKARSNVEVDGFRAHQVHLIPSDSDRRLSAEDRERRDQMELRIFALREKKTGMDEELYYRELEVLLVEFARLSEEIAKRGEAIPSKASGNE